MDNEMDDYELESGEPEIDFESEGFPERPPERPVIWIIAAAAVVILVAISLFFFMRSDPEPEVATEKPALEAPSPEAKPTVIADEAEPPLELPNLGTSDAFVRELAHALSSRPELAKWLATDELVRRLVAVIANVAEGTSPRPHLTFLAPEGKFEALEIGGGRVVLDPRSYNRYNQLAAVVGSLDARGTAKLIRNLEPLMNEAYRELGYPGGDFDTTLRKAIRSLLAVPVLADDAVRLEPGVTAFKYSLPELESLSPAQKHLLRAGPENTRIFQAKLREIQEALAQTPGSAG